MTGSQSTFLATCLCAAATVLTPKEAEAEARRLGRPRPALEFLGWDYERLGYSLYPGEDMALRFRNNREEAIHVRVDWALTTYDGRELKRGQTDLAMAAGCIGTVPIIIPGDLADGAYWVQHMLTGPQQDGKPKRFHFDFRRPEPDPLLNLTVTALIENMDAKGWVRMLLGPLARYATVHCNWAASEQRPDVVLLLGETMAEDNPRIVELRAYLEVGGRVVVFGKPSPVFADFLPVVMDDESRLRDDLLGFAPRAGVPWYGMSGRDVPPRYGFSVKAKPDAEVLATWDDGTPAVVSGRFGKGTVVYVGTGSGQVWQVRPALAGGDEMALRLLYWLGKGEAAVVAMLARAEELYQEETAARIAVRDRVVAGLDVAAPDEFVVVSRGNVGRFGWLIEEGGLVENMSAGGRVSGPKTRDFSFHRSQPVVNMGNLRSTGAEAAYTVEANGDARCRPGAVQQNWLAKTVTWHYGNGSTIRSTLSLGSPAILWEGEGTEVRFTYESATHWAYASPEGIRVIEAGATVSGSDLTEGWLLAFTARDQVRDMPQLFVLTRRPRELRIGDGLGLTYSEGGFGAVCAMRLWGVRRLAPGATTGWSEAVPGETLEAARLWNRVLLHYPMDCDEIGWVEGDSVLLADRYGYRELRSDWGVEPLVLAPLPPVLSLAKSVGAPVELPENRVDLACPTTCGFLEAVPGDCALVRLPLPPMEHRGLLARADGLALQEAIDHRAHGLALGQPFCPANRNRGAGDLDIDLEPYDRSGQVPYTEAPCIDVYKWWYTFNALLARPIYSPTVREKVDRHFRQRYWETLNTYPHKCFVQQKREPWTGTGYQISFVYPVQTGYGFRNFNDANEASGINAYCLANYARYYGDWATLRANWNLCRRLHEYLPRVNDWAVMASGALEYWYIAGLDMINSEPYGNLAFAYAARHTGQRQDELTGLVLGAKAHVPTVARFGLGDYLQAISAEGDVWREFRGFHWLSEDGFQLARKPLGSIGMHDTSKGTFHEQSLGYAVWIPDAIHAYEAELESIDQNAMPDLFQRLLLGWDPEGLMQKAHNRELRQPPNWQSTRELYETGVLCLADVPVFPTDWAPAEYRAGVYDPQRRELSLRFRSHEGKPFTVALYSRLEPISVRLGGEPVPAEESVYDRNSGRLAVRLAGADEQHLTIRFGEALPVSHPCLGGQP